MNTSIQPPLTNLQMELLKLFSRQLPEKDLHAIRDLISQYLLERSFELAWRTKNGKKGKGLHGCLLCTTDVMQQFFLNKLRVCKLLAKMRKLNNRS